jgi:hypothetical protein
MREIFPHSCNANGRQTAPLPNPEISTICIPAGAIPQDAESFNSVCRKHQLPRFRNSENVKGFTPGPTHATNELRAALQLQSNSCTLDNLKHIMYDN